MPDYEAMYFRLFNAVTDAVEELQRLNFGTAVEILKRAQQDGEDSYVAGEETETLDRDGEKAQDMDTRRRRR